MYFVFLLVQSFPRRSGRHAGAASGLQATANGFRSEASGDGSAAIGSYSSASAFAASAFGYGAEASQESATALGFGAVASNYDSTALGSNAIASGDNSVAVGGAFFGFLPTEAAGDYSVGVGGGAYTPGGDHGWDVAAWAIVAVDLFVVLRRIGSFRIATAALFAVPLVFFLTIFLRSAMLVGRGATATWCGREVPVR